MDNQQPNFKHYCRVCKKGFMCGRALGGHMRAHGIGDENGNLDDDDTASDWEEKFGGDRNSNKRMYRLRTNPNRLKSCRSCDNCGKEFLSWKSFLEHGKCSYDDASESLVSSPESEGDDDCGKGGRRGGGWSKRKRSLRAKVGCLSSSNYATSEEDDLLLATCLVQLANTTVDLPEESSASASKEEERRNPSFVLSKNRPTLDHKTKGASNPRGLFECKACKKVFNSHQALGGHRASHKKVKGCYAAKQDQQEDNNVNSTLAVDEDVTTNNDHDFLPSKSTNSSFQFEQGQTALVGATRRKSKVHECSICHRVFNSGQALGGHKRCHWIISNPPEISLPKFQLQDNTQQQPQRHHNPSTDVSEKLDLNVPAWANVTGVRRDPRNPLSFEVSTEMHLQSRIGCEETKDKTPHCHSQKQLQQKNEDDNNNNKAKNGIHCVDDEADSKSKLSKLGDLKDMNANNVSSSQWLQVGIASTTESAAASGDA